MSRLLVGVWRVVVAGVAACALVMSGGVAWAADPPAPGADPNAPLPSTVTADALPTWQINGVVYSQAVVGDTVYAVGSFTRARPPGVAAGGAGEVVANNVFAYSLSTGNRVASFSHSLNAQALVVKASADGSRIYVGGDFTTVDGVNRGHVAAFSTANGSLVTTFAPNVGGQVRGLGITTSTVFVGGNFTSANGVARTRLAAFNTSNGAMTPWAPSATGGYVWTMAMTPDNSAVVAGGSFTQLSGVNSYGMGAISAADGSIRPWAAQEKIRDAGANGAITALKSDGTQIYGSGYSFTQDGSAMFEGTFAANPNGGAINWVNDCLGDTYDVAPGSQVLYAVSHYHDCTVVGGHPDTNPRVRWQKATAQVNYPTNISTRDDVYGWASRSGLIGLPYAQMLHWYPNLAFGSYTPARQAAWAVDTAGDYVVMGGEFPRVNNTNQQGLVRFKTRPTAPKLSGPTYSTVPATPIPATTAVSLEAGAVRVSFGTAWDMDDETLKYEVLRDNNTWLPDKVQNLKSNFWTLPRAGIIDTGLAPGSTHRYAVRITDQNGNTLWAPTSNTVTVGSGAASTYTNTVRGDGASHLWRLGEDSGATGIDYTGFDDVTFTGGYTRGAAGAMLNEADKASSLGGVDGFAVNSTREAGPSVFSSEAWFKTTSTTGGKILGFGDRNTGTSSNYDRHTYLDDAGRVFFGVWNNGAYTVNTGPGLNDGQWHHVVGTMDATGLTLYVDGKRIGRNTGTTVAQPYDGYWRIGGDSPWGGDAYFDGDVDDVALYPSALTQAQVQKHYTDSGRTLDIPVRPSDTYGAAVWDSNPDLYWRLGEASGTVARDSSPNDLPGVYTSGGVSYGTPGAVSGTTNTAVSLAGVPANGVASSRSISNPTVYSEELWFKTTTTQGGKLIGFGCAQTGNSGCYDRHVYMFNDGRLRFGVWTGQINVTDTTASYNDGQWHHVVATQGSGGMKLHVDGGLVGSNPQTAAENYTGYWRVGGDTAWGGNSSDWFAGDIDEVAVYPSALSDATVQAHFQAGGGQLPNQLPTAAFTQNVTNLAVAFDGSSSSDPDGTIASYAWDFGDTGTGAGATPSHTYQAAGTYDVTLTVTDNRGGTNTVTHPVTVTAPPANQPPTASFTATTNNLAVSVNGSGSTDPDGTIASYAWDFGDTGTGTGATASHTYAAPGTYQVRLTVTDNGGLTATSVQDVTVTAAANQVPTAAFTVTTNNLAVSVDGSGSSDPDGTIASYAWDFGDTATGTGATASHTYAAAGTYQVTLTVTDDDGATDTETKSVTVSPVTAFAVDAFSRSVASGWGTADQGGPWSVTGTASRYSVDGQVGRVSLAAGASATTFLGGVSQTDLEVAATVSTSVAPTGSGQYVSVLGRRVSSTADYRAKLRLAANGQVTAWLTRMQSGTETTISTATVPGLTYAAGDKLRVRLQVSGTGPTALQMKVWKDGTTEPATWQLTGSDATAALQLAGSVGFYDYVSSSTTNAPVVFTVDDLWVGQRRP